MMDSGSSSLSAWARSLVSRAAGGVTGLLPQYVEALNVHSCFLELPGSPGASDPASSGMRMIRELSVVALNPAFARAWSAWSVSLVMRGDDALFSGVPGVEGQDVDSCVG